MGDGTADVDGTGGTAVGTAERDVTGTAAAMGAATGRWQAEASAQHTARTPSTGNALLHRIIGSRLADPPGRPVAWVAAQFAW